MARSLGRGLESRFLLGALGIAWTYLVLAGLLEIVWAVGLKYTVGFTRLAPTVITATAMAFSLGLLGLALKSIPVGTAILGIVLFAEPATAARLACIGLIVAGLIGLELVTPWPFARPGRARRKRNSVELRFLPPRLERLP